MPRLSGLAVTLILAVAAGLARPLPASSRLYPVDDIRPGQVAQGRTVFTGTTLEPFTARILGVLKNVMAPRRTLILARLEGGPLASTGVIAGMSGSPVYIDGRLVGAVSYSLGAFSKEPIAGITPIGEMIEAAGLDAPRPRLAAVAWPRGAGLDDPLRDVTRAFATLAPFARSPFDAQVLGGADQALAGTGARLQPIAVPLGLSGFSASTVAALEPTLQSSGFLPATAGIAAGAAAGGLADDAPLRPGDPVGVTLVRGDLEIGATGTVTEVDGSKVYAFGHPFYNLGPTAFPMTRVYVHAVLPSLQNSMKIASTGAVIGTFSDDRFTALAGRLGPGPALIPVTLAFTGLGATRTFHMEVAQDQLFTPLMTYLSVVETLTAWQRQAGAASYTVTGQIVLKGGGLVPIDDVFTGDQAPLAAGGAVLGPVNVLLRNAHDPVAIERIGLTITGREDVRSAVLERVTVDAPRVHPGDTVPLTLQVRTYRGGLLSRTVPIRIPPQARGAVSILVADAARLAQADPRDQAPSQARDLPRLLETFREAKHTNRIYVRLVMPDSGAVVRGESLPSLPASVIAVLEGDRPSGGGRTIGGALIGNWDAAFDAVVTGSRTLTIALDD